MKKYIADNGNVRFDLTSTSVTLIALILVMYATNVLSKHSYSQVVLADTSSVLPRIWVKQCSPQDLGKAVFSPEFG